MKAKLVYLAGPIFGKTDDECRAWRQDARAKLHAKNVNTLDPTSNDYRYREEKFRSQLVEQDKKWIMSVDTVLAYCDEPSFGTAMELLFAWEQHKQVVAISTHRSPWLHYHATVVCKSLNEAVELLHP